MPKLDSTDRSTDMDPFTVFGMFNKQMMDANRITFCQALKELFSIDADVPSDFDGIPVLNPLSATFYCFANDPRRGERDIDHLWDCFAASLRYADEGGADAEREFIAAYNTVKDLTGNKWKLSMGLFWIRPQTFLNLDSRNQWYLKECVNLSNALTAQLKAMKGIPDGETYIALCRECVRCVRSDPKYGSIAGLSYEAWEVSESVNMERGQEGQLRIDTDTFDIDQDVRQTRYWLYAPGHNAVQWDTFYKEGIMAIGWGETGDLRNYPDREAIKVKLRDEWNSPDSSAIFPSLALWQFLHEMKPGDIMATPRN